MMNISNGLAALSMLSGSNSYTDYGSTLDFETRAVRLAKAQFTLAPTTPPWKQPASSTPESAQISAIKRMASIIDASKSASKSTAGSSDIQTAFTTYKALDKLQLLATAAARRSTSPADRATLQAAFDKGLADLQTFMAQANSDKVELAFGQPARRAETVSVVSSDATKFTGDGVVAARDAALPGLTGNEVLKISLNKPGASDTVTVDLSTTSQPPTLDSVSDAINGAIKAIPLRTLDGSVVLDGNGDPISRWQANFLPDKSTGSWGLSLRAPNGTERVSLDQVGASDSLVVASGRTAFEAPTVTQIMRFDDAEGTMTRNPLSTIASVDRLATARATLTAPKPIKGVTPASTVVNALTTTQAIATDASGFSYAVGTSSGDLKSNLSSGKPDLLLTKMDSEGKVVWQRSLGASGATQGAAVSVSANGDVTVAGTVSGAFDGLSTDGDIVVAQFNARGDEKFATVIRSYGADTANAVAVGADGSIFVGGKAATGSGDAFVARLDTSGRLQERRTIDSGGSESIKALAIDQDGNLLALMNESGNASLRSISATSLATDLGSLSLGNADARALAVAADGSIAVAGATNTAIDGGQANAMGSGRDGFVTRIDSGLSNATTSYIATSGDDQVDSITFMNGALYAGGRTTGDLDGTRQGNTDGFVTRLDAASGAIETTTQFGQFALKTEPVRIAAGNGSDSVLGALGLHRGTLNSETSIKLVAQTSLRAGDEFSISVGSGRAQKITIQADDTLVTLGDRVRRATGFKVTVATAKVNGATVLRIDPKAGTSVSLLAGANDKDALAKLGLEPGRISVPAQLVRGAPKVHPGGTFGLALNDALNVTTVKDAMAAMTSLKDAISMTQTAYRSLYWDDGKAALTNGSSGSAVLTPAQSAQLASYKSALARLTPVADATNSDFFTGL